MAVLRVKQLTLSSATLQQADQPLFWSLQSLVSVSLVVTGYTLRFINTLSNNVGKRISWTLSQNVLVIAWILRGPFLAFCIRNAYFLACVLRYPPSIRSRNDQSTAVNVYWHSAQYDAWLYALVVVFSQASTVINTAFYNCYRAYELRLLLSN